MTPPPITIMCLGISFSSKASVEVITRSLSKVIKGNEPGFDPVAIMVFLASMVVSLSPSILMWVASTKLPKPLKTVILFFSIRKSIPLVVCSTTPRLRAIIFSKLTLISPGISIPWVSKCLIASS